MTFSEKTLDFLIENRVRDDRNWYIENKPTFIKYVLTPMQELVEELSDFINGVDPQLICQPKIGKSISRLHRDTRFSKDKSLYRDHIWCIFIRDKKLYNGLPGFFFEISPQGFTCGCGYYHADNESMSNMRKLILNSDKTFLKAHRALKNQDTFELVGELYKKPKFPDAKAEYHTWLNRKSVCLIHHSQDFELLFSDKLGAWLEEQFKTIVPVYEFFAKAESMKIR